MEKEVDGWGKNLNEGNSYISTKWDQLNRSVDMFFTNQESKDDKKSSILIYTSFYKKEGEPVTKDYDFQFKISLPNTTKNLKIIVEKQQDEIANALSDTSVTSNKLISKNAKISNKKSARYTAGAKINLKQTNSFNSSFNFGIRVDVPLNPYAKFEIQKSVKFSFLDIGLSQKFIYYRQEGFQEISQVIFTKKWNNKFQLDFAHFLVWSEESDKFSLRHNIVFTQSLSQRKSISLSVGANAQFSPTYYYSSYDTSISYSQLLHSDWLYATATTGIDFAKDKHFNDDKFVQIRIDIFFR
ncbi:MAG: hypothetical protein K2Q18_04325 [Bdellovibrionales bacterium]|nr:hypothetical protein [Bdellovibrionales bacterium]